MYVHQIQAMALRVHDSFNGRGAKGYSLVWALQPQLYKVISNQRFDNIQFEDDRFCSEFDFTIDLADQLVQLQSNMLSTPEKP